MEMCLNAAKTRVTTSPVAAERFPSRRVNWVRGRSASRRPLRAPGQSHVTIPVPSRHLSLRTATVLFPGAAQHVALAEWCAADPGSFRARSLAYPGFGDVMMRNDPGSAAHRSARAARCTASGKSTMALTPHPTIEVGAPSSSGLPMRSQPILSRSIQSRRPPWYSAG